MKSMKELLYPPKTNILETSHGFHGLTRIYLNRFAIKENGISVLSVIIREICG
jgi:hypothetical protein